MKVNISGKGVIPGVGSLAPVRGIDLSEREIRRILPFRFNVYSATSGKRITPDNIVELINAESNNAVIDETPVVENKKKATKKETYVAPVVEEVVEPVVVTPIEEEIVDTVEPIVEPIADAVEPIDIDDDSFSDKDDFDYNATDVVDVVEETTSYPKKNKKKKK